MHLKLRRQLKFIVKLWSRKSHLSVVLVVTRGTSQNERNRKYDFADIMFLNGHERSMPLKNLLHASFLVILKCHKHGHVHIGNSQIQSGQRVWNPLENNEFYRFLKKTAIWPHHLGKGLTP